MDQEDDLMLFEEFRKSFQGSQRRTTDSGEWMKTMRDNLYQMLTSPMKQEYTNEAFKWIANLCMTLDDFSWISDTNQWLTGEIKIFSCISRLSLNELTILLPLIQRHLTCGDAVEEEDGKVLARSANKTEYDMFGVHLVILENVIKCLIKSQDESNSLAEKMSANGLKSLLDHLKETVDLLCEYLELVHTHWQQLCDEPQSQRSQVAEAALRVICAWMSEEPVGLKAQCKRYLIDLMLKNLLTNHRSLNEDLIILALHSICTNHTELMDKLHATQECRTGLERYLSHVESEQKKSTTSKRQQKMFKLRVGLIKDLITRASTSS